VDLLKGVPPNWRLTIETEKVLDALPADVAVETPHALDVNAKTAWSPCAERRNWLCRSGPRPVWSAWTWRNSAAWLRTRPATSPACSGFQSRIALRVRAGSIQPEIEAVARNNFRVSAEQVSLSAMIDYTIKCAVCSR